MYLPNFRACFTGNLGKKVSEETVCLNFMVTPCINNTEPFSFYYQLMHITLNNAELLKHSKLDNLECFNNSAFF